jgi:hypothetical protein
MPCPGAVRPRPIQQESTAVDTPGSGSAPPVIMVWRSVRAGGDTKTRKSRRALELRQRCTDALCLHRDRQDQLRKRAGDRWHYNGLVFASRVGAALWARNVRRRVGYPETTTTETVPPGKSWPRCWRRRTTRRRARSSRSTSGSGPRASGRATAAAARRSRTGAAAPCCRCLAPSSCTPPRPGQASGP